LWERQEKKKIPPGVFLVSFCAIPPIIVAAERETPGIIAKT